MIGLSIFLFFKMLYVLLIFLVFLSFTEIQLMYNGIFVSGIQHNDLMHVYEMIATISLVNIYHLIGLQWGDENFDERFDENF